MNSKFWSKLRLHFYAAIVIQNNFFNCKAVISNNVISRHGVDVEKSSKIDIDLKFDFLDLDFLIEGMGKNIGKKYTCIYK